jgi:hypothetical protein
MVLELAKGPSNRALADGTVHTQIPGSRLAKAIQGSFNTVWANRD